MSDRIAADIEIGGPLGPKAYIALAEAAIDGPRFDDYAGIPATARNIKARIRRIARNGETLTLADDEATEGRFPGIEAVCHAHGLTYVRRSDGKYEYDSAVVWWRPGMPEPGFSYATQNGGRLLPYSEIAELHRVWKDDPGQLVARLGLYLEDHAACEVPPLTLEKEDPGGR